MVRERARWSLIQMMIVGLQGIPIAQILSITLVQLIYFVVILKESKHGRIFSSLWLKMKILFQEFAILVFVMVLSLFSLAQNSNLRKSSTFTSLEYTVIVAMIAAVICELLLMIYIIYAVLRQFISSVTKNKADVDNSD